MVAGKSCRYTWNPSAYDSQPQALPTPITLPAPLPPQQSTSNSSALASQSVAYTRVVARPVNLRKSSEGGSWPESLRKYVERAFALAAGSGQRPEIQLRLKTLIAEAQQQGKLWTKDWDSTPLPEVEETGHLPVLPLVQQEHYGSQASRNYNVLRYPSTFLLHMPTRIYLSRYVRRERLPCRQPKRARSPDNAVKAGKKKGGKIKQKHGLHSNTSRTSVLDEQRERARARRFGTGSAVGAGHLEKVSEGHLTSCLRV